MSGIDVNTKGGLLKGKGKAVISNAVDEINTDTGQEMYNRVQNRLRSVLQHPSGHYQSMVTTDLSANSVAVTDGGVIYGSWLEGTSSRNSSTNFKGYGTFRKIQKEMQSDAPKQADKIIGRAVGKLQ
jgi:hypothetical protein